MALTARLRRCSDSVSDVMHFCRGGEATTMPLHDPQEKFLPFTFRPETGPTIRTLALCLDLHYENARHALPMRISARIGSSI